MVSQISRLFSFLLVIAAVILAVPPARATSSADPGGEIYKAKCAGCHGADGSGDTPVGKSLRVRDLRSDEVQRQTDLELTKVIAGGKNKMPGFGKKMTSDQIQSVIAFIRTLKK